MDLTSKHIKNCKLLVDRHELINFWPKKAIIAELGIDEATFSKDILSICNPKEFLLFDNWGSKRYNEVKERNVRRWAKGYNNVYIHKGDSCELMNQLPDNYLDVVYIDTVHNYIHTKKELLISKDKVKDSGLICGHDYTQGNINKPLKYGVVEAVNEFCIEYNYEFIYLTHETERHLSFAIKKMK